MASASPNLPALIYNGVEIHETSERLCLTDMWRAAGSPEGKRPDDWKKDGANRAFLEHIAMIANAPVKGIWKGTRGATGATFAHWQVGMNYARWLDPAFAAWCNTVVRERMEGRSLVPLSLADDKAAMNALGGLVKRCSGVVVREEMAAALPMIASEIAAETIRTLRVEGMLPIPFPAAAITHASEPAPSSPTSIPALINAHRTLIALDEALYDDEGAPKSAGHEASDKALGLVINALIAAPCVSIEDAQAKARYLISAPIGDREPVASALAPSGADPFDPAGALLSLLRSLAGEPPPIAAAA